MALLSALLVPSLAGAGLPKSSNVPGGIVRVPLAPWSESAPPPQAWLDEQRVLVMAEGGQWVALVGLSLDRQPGTYHLRIEGAPEKRQASFVIHAKHYPAQHITLQDSGKVDLSDADLARVEGEMAKIQRLKRHWRESEFTDTQFALPAEGKLSGRFGLRRYFNGQARAPHAGFDIAVPRGSAVRANASGVVLDVGEYFFNGKTVFVDHGNGLLSMYCHLDRIDVSVGQTVDKRQVLGLSGMTGRATGPHLHWSVILNGAMVDPELFVVRPASKR
ncbi:MAG TPA: peptidoglycan DD-metalloendopeptidase family protein [Accumulibacter sp.]|nr:peptidoglycan DD-metalloendopeptidase family protein [Accumulibacter sp.]HNC19135.1 peptidoglycan DD-metalloendopeptidase family protein [Accumulibacter sp.]HNM76552.1 peptidoglycan DD-metalloendopeptidase family protein [Accumulibacter sp.]